jgi:ABC-type dipeptide/oligopeptide/nickel transport system permease subunit
VSKLFTPIGVVVGLVAGQISKKIFDKVWSLIKDEEAPRPKHREVPLATLVIALLVEGAIARVVRGMVDHGTRHGWAQLTGEWPGEERPEEE